MSKERIKEIKDRMAWLSTELVHEGYYPGIVAEGLKKELDRLIKELQELQKDLNKE